VARAGKAVRLPHPLDERQTISADVGGTDEGFSVGLAGTWRTFSKAQIAFQGEIGTIRFSLGS
jgi:hypothetical protein